MEEPVIKGRVTSKKFVEWLNKKFEQLEINEYEVTEVYRTRHRVEDYEAGAARLIVTFRHKREYTTGTFLCFYSLSQYESYLLKGYKMILIFNNDRFGLNLLKDLEVDVVKAK